MLRFEESSRVSMMNITCFSLRQDGYNATDYNSCWSHDKGMLSTFTGPLWGESISDWWIPLIKGQQWWTVIWSLLLAWTSCWTNSRHDDVVIRDALTSIRHNYNVQLIFHQCNTEIKIYWILFYGVTYLIELILVILQTFGWLRCQKVSNRFH